MCNLRSQVRFIITEDLDKWANTLDPEKFEQYEEGRHDPIGSRAAHMSLSNPVEIGSHRLTIRQYPEDHPFLHMIEEDKKAQEPPSMMDLETCPVHTEP